MNWNKIVENNKKELQFFMGLAHEIKPDVFDPNKQREYFYSQGHPGNWRMEKEIRNQFAPEHLMYQSDWDWLMPVVEKIESIEGVNFNIFSSEAKISIRYDIVLNSVSETKIEAVYNTVIEYIKWHKLNAA
ncbi:MAG: hypothetical protein HC896_00170 [Bacteroidales bacterium]|nr:hypothetical protein [Bacteroidales bacterium]